MSKNKQGDRYYYSVLDKIWLIKPVLMAYRNLTVRKLERYLRNKIEKFEAKIFLPQALFLKKPHQKAFFNEKLYIHLHTLYLF